MPYQSEAQRRFFHSSGGRKAGITPAMVKEWDEASRGKDLPERAEKSAALLSLLIKAAAAANAVRPGSSPVPKPPKPMKTDQSAMGQDEQSPNFLMSFRDNSSAGAARGADDRLQRGEQLTMPT